MENGGSKRRNLREWEKKRNCPFDAKKVCPVTFQSVIEQTETPSAEKSAEGVLRAVCGVE